MLVNKSIYCASLPSSVQARMPVATDEDHCELPKIQAGGLKQEAIRNYRRHEGILGKLKRWIKPDELDNLLERSRIFTDQLNAGLIHMKPPEVLAQKDLERLNMENLIHFGEQRESIMRQMSIEQLNKQSHEDFMWLSFYSKPDFLAWVLNRLEPRYFTYQDSSGHTPLLWLLSQARLDAAKVLIDHISQQQLGIVSKSGGNAFKYAVFNIGFYPSRATFSPHKVEEKIELARSLLEKMTPAQLAQQDVMGKTSLMYLISKNVPATKQVADFTEALISKMELKDLWLTDKYKNTAISLALSDRFFSTAYTIWLKFLEHPQKTNLIRELNRNSALGPEIFELIKRDSTHFDSFEWMAFSENPRFNTEQRLEFLESSMMAALPTDLAAFKVQMSQAEQSLREMLGPNDYRLDRLMSLFYDRLGDTPKRVQYALDACQKAVRQKQTAAAMEAFMNAYVVTGLVDPMLKAQLFALAEQEKESLDAQVLKDLLESLPT